MAISKNVSFRGPYIGRTFQTLTRDLLGRDGYLEGAHASDDGVSITLGPYAFVQGGILCRQDAVSTVPVPSGPPPWFVLASAIDDDPATGVLVSTTSDVSQIGGAVVLAYKMNGRWSQPLPISGAGISAADARRKGRESGLRPIPSIVPGTLGPIVASFEVSRGVAVDSRGERRELGASLPGMASFAPFLPGLTERNDYVVLRRREAGAEIVIAQGGAVASTAALSSFGGVIDSGPLVTRPSLLSRRGGVSVQLAYAWANGTALKLGSALDIAISGGATTGYFNPITVHTGAAPIGNVLVVWQRPSDKAILVLFTEGSQIKLAAFSAKDGSVVNAPVRIDAQPNACTHVHAQVDVDGFLHIVYQHDEGGAPPSQQVYYTKRATEGATFGAAAVTPRLVNGVLSTKNDTWPTLGVDRQRRVHIAYATGNGSDELGQLRYVVLDQNGSALWRATLAEYGHQPDPNGPGVLVSASSIVANIRRPKVVVTPHDEVDVFMVVQRVGAAGPDELALYHPGFAERLGFPIVILSHLFPASGAGTDTLAAFGATSDDLGQLLVFAEWTAAGLLYQRLDTVLAPLGSLSDSYLEDAPAAVRSVANPRPDVFVTLGAAGEIVYGLLDGTNAVLGLVPARMSGRSFTPHPDDAILSGWQLDAPDKQLFGQQALPETDFQVFSLRPKKMSYPVLVGDDGDYQGYGSLLDALAVANKKGGHVVVRGGSHRPSGPVVLGSGVRVEGEGHVLLDCPPLPAPAAGWVQLGQMPGPVGCTVASPIVTVAGAPPLRGVVRPGDLCEFFDASGASTGLFRVRRVLDDTRMVTDGNPKGTTVVVYACGVELSNVSLTTQPGSALLATTPLMLARALYGGRIDCVKIAGRLAVGGAALRLSRCRETTARNVDVLSTTGTAGSFGIWLDGGGDNAVERALVGDADGTCLRVEPSESNPRLIDCGSSQATPARILVDAPRTTPVFLKGCAARIDGDVGHVVTPVGKILSAVSGRGAPAGALQFQDENTLQFQGGVPLDLTAPSAAGSQFNGATPRVLVPSVNERLLRAGDSMTGELGVPSLLLAEAAAPPAAPPAGSVRLYLQSNGSAPGQSPPQHRSQLVMLMPSGETLIVAQTDPT